MELEKLFKKAQSLRNNGQIKEAVANYQKVIDQTDDPKLEAEAIHMIGVTYKQSNDVEKSQEYLNKAVEKFKELGDQGMVGAVLRDLGVLSRNNHKTEEAKRYMEESIEALEKVDMPGHLGVSRAKLGLVLADMGQMEKAEDTIKEGISNIENSPDRFFESTAYYNLAEVQEKAGKKEEARGSLQKAQEILDTLGEPEEFLERRKQFIELLDKISQT